MLYLYKIQHLRDMNGKEKFGVKYRKPGFYYKLLGWGNFGNYKSTLKQAQEMITRELKKDEEVERKIFAKKNKVLKEYNYKIVPNHIPEEQMGKFMGGGK